MPKTCEIPNSTRSEAISLYNGGYGVAHISRTLNVNWPTFSGKEWGQSRILKGQAVLT